MERVKRGETYALINPRTREVERRLDARSVFDKIVDSAWRNGEPGVIFIDRINLTTRRRSLARSRAQPLRRAAAVALRVLRTGSINLAKFYRGGRINYDRLSQVVGSEFTSSTT